MAHRHLRLPAHPTRIGTICLCLFGLLVVSVPLSAQTGTVSGRVENAGTGQPISDVVVTLQASGQSVTTDIEGRFRLTAVMPGRHVLRVEHLGYGERSVELDVAGGQAVAVRVLLSDSAIALTPISVEALSLAERQARGAGFRRGVVRRDQIAQSEGSNMNLGEVLRQYVPGVRVRTAGNLAGAPLCIELRTIQASFRNQCLSPAVYLDGVPVSNPTVLFTSLSLRMLESMEVIPAAEAGARFGTGALYGALMIETRRPGAGDGTDAERNLGPRIFDWTQESGSHPVTKSFAYAFIGNAAGLALGLLAANQCIEMRKPSNDRIISTCTSGATLASASAAVILPALGGALGSGLGGRTDLSRGRLLPALLGGAMALLPAYGLYFSGQRLDSGFLNGLSGSLLVVGVPLAATVADRQFRNWRDSRRN